MRLILLLSFFAICAPVTSRAAAPMSTKDVALMVRMGLRDAEIVAEVEKRRLLTPIDAANETALRQSGATDTLIATLKTGGYVMSQDEAARAARQLAIQREQAAHQQAAESEAFHKRQRQLAG